MLVNLASEMYRYGDYEDALDIYLQAIEENPNNVKAHFYAGKCLLETTSRKGEAISYFKKAYDLDPEIHNKIFFYIGQSYQFNYKFDEAKNYYLLFKEELETNRRLFEGENTDELIKLANRKIYECKNGKLFVNNPRKVEIENLGPVVNSQYQEYAPNISADGQKLYFTSRRSGSEGGLKDQDNDFFEDIWVSEKVDTGWGSVKKLKGKINSKTHESNLSISPDGNELYVYKDIEKGDIFISKYSEKKQEWGKVKPFKHLNTDARESGMSISSDGELLFFSSDREGGNGQGDIYWCKKIKKNKWSDPENLGEVINTEYDEDGPSFDSKTKVLYFSSSGHKGMGGFDVYYSKYDEATGEWTKPRNLGYPINTPLDDLHFTISGDSNVAYFASSREESSYGEQDLYYVLPEIENIKDSVPPNNEDSLLSKVGDKPVVVVVNVEGENNENISAHFKLVHIEDEVTIKDTIAENARFEREFNLLKQEPFMLSIESKGYLFQTIRLEIPPMGNDTFFIEKNIVLKKPKTKKVNVLRNVYYEFDQHTLNHASTSELNLLTEFLNNNSTSKIEIAGHTDFIGPEGYNDNLSSMRASEVRNYLIKRGINPSRITTKGYGESRPLASNDDEDEGREINRRTEFIILEK